jgi:serine protease inhibitor
MKKIFLTITALFVLCTACTKDGAKKIDSSNTNGLADAFGKANAADQFLINIYRQIVEVLPHTDNMGSRWGTGLPVRYGNRK